MYLDSEFEFAWFLIERLGRWLAGQIGVSFILNIVIQSSITHSWSSRVWCYARRVAGRGRLTLFGFGSLVSKHLMKGVLTKGIKFRCIQFNEGLLVFKGGYLDRGLMLGHLLYRGLRCRLQGLHRCVIQLVNCWLKFGLCLLRVEFHLAYTLSYCWTITVST